MYNLHPEFIKIYNKDITDSLIIKYLKKFNSDYLAYKNVNNLSWWEFQKMLIVSSLISNPDILLLDEPTSWIDIVWEDIFYKNIAEVKKAFPKISIILVSHNLHLVYKNSDKVVCLHKNNLCCHWTPLEIKENTEINEIFWEYILPYEHKPHSKHNH